MELGIMSVCFQRSHHFHCSVDPPSLPKDPHALIDPRCAKILQSHMQYFFPRINSCFCLCDELNLGKELSISNAHETLQRYSL